MEPGEPDEQVDAGEELHEAWYPHAPDPGRDVDRPAPLGEPEQLLSAVDQLARAEAEEADRDGDEGRRRERDRDSNRQRLPRYHFERRPRRLVYISFGRAVFMPVASNCSR